MAKTYLLISDEFSGEVNTASSLGSAPAAEIVGPKVGTDLKFKRLKAGANIALNDSDPNYVEITASVPTAAANAFDRFSLPDGNDAVADGATDTISFRTPDDKVVITGAPDDFVNFTVDETNFDQSAFSHNSISDVDANQHVDHASVFINSGGALTGGGAITESQTITLDINGLLPDETPSTTDYLMTYDADQMNHKKVTIDSILPPPTPQANSFGRVNTPDANSLDADLPTDSLNLQTGNNKLDITGDVGTDTVTFTVQEGNITHDNLNGVSSNQHVDHTQVNVLGGEGLTNSGDTTIASNVVVDLDILGLDPNASPNTSTSHIVVHDGVSHKKVIIDNILPEPTPQADSYKTVTVNGTPVVADVPSDNLTITSTNKLNVTGNDTNNSISLDVNEANLSISHNNLTDVDANQHIDHSTINITAGNGLSGGGTIDNPTINLDLDINDIPTTIQPLDKAADYVAFYDTSDLSTKKVLIQDIGGQGNVIGPASATDNAVARFDTTTGELLQDSSLSVTDTGEVLGVDGTTSNPTYSFSNDTDTGIYTPTSDTLAVTTGGVDKLSVNPTSINALTKINSTAGLYRYNTTYTTSTTISGNDDVVYADATAGNIVLTLPSIGNMCTSITKIDSTTFTVTLQATGADTILGQSTYVLDKQWDSIYLSRKITGEWYPMTISSDLSDNQVIDHADVSISAGEGLGGGGTITENRALSLNFDQGLIEELTPNGATDYVAVYNAAAGAHRKVLIDNLPLSGGGGGGTGNVTGPATSTDNAIVRYSGTTGDLIQDYVANAPTIDDNGVASFNDATYTNSERIGAGSSVTGTDTTVFGQGASSVGSGTSIGHAASVSNTFGTAIGKYSIAFGGTAVGFLADSSTNATGTALGRQAICTGVATTAVGHDAEALAVSTTSIGAYTRDGGGGGGNTLIGAYANTVGSAAYSTAIGYGTLSQAQDATAIGRQAQATGVRSTAIGTLSNDGGFTDCTLIGFGVSAQANNTVAIGRSVAPTLPTGATHPNVAIGNSIQYGRHSNVAIGNTVTIADDSGRNVVIGASSRTTYVSGANSVIVGYNANSASNGTINIGSSASVAADAHSSIIIGASTTSSGLSGIALGVSADVEADYGISIGGNSTTRAAYSICIGHSSSSSLTGFGGTAIGVNAIVQSDYSIAIGWGADALNANCIVLGKDATTEIDNCFVVGSVSARMDHVYLGHGYRTVSNIAPDLDLQPAKTSGTWADVRGGDFDIRGGTSTGTARGGSVKISTVTAGGVSGTTENTTYKTMADFHSEGDVILAAKNSAPTTANMFNGSFTTHLDESGNNLIFTIKYSNGTIKTATIALV